MDGRSAAPHRGGPGTTRRSRLTGHLRASPVSVASAAQQRFYLEEQRTRTAEVSAYAIMLPFLVACLGSVDDTLRRVEGRVPGGGGAAPSAAHCPVRDEQSGALHQRVLSMDECGM